MPDNNNSSLFPSLDIERGQAAINEPTISLPDYNFQGQLSNLSQIYSEISRIKSQSPLSVKTGASSSSSSLFPSLDKAIKAPPGVQDVAPIAFDPISESLDRYKGSKHFKDVGFLPGRDNEELYGRAQGTWESLTNGLVGSFKLAKFQFVDQLKGWGRLVEGIFSGDLSTLYDDGDVNQVNDKMNQIMNDNPIFMTAHDRDSVFTWKNFANSVQQTGFTLGALSEIAAEEILMTAVTTATLGGTSEIQAARTAQIAARIPGVFRKMAGLEEVLMEASKARKLFNKVLDFTPFSNTASTFIKGARAGENTAQFALRGFGGFYRDLREANAAFTEARAESSGTYSQLKQDLLASTPNLTPGKLEEIEKTAKQGADANFWANAAIIGISNRLEFNNVLRGYKGAGKFLSETGEILSDKAGFFRRSVTPFTKGFGRTFKEEVLKGKAPLKYFKNNLTEALQENLQNVSNNAVQAYYKANYANPGTGQIRDSIMTALSGEVSTEGAKTFLGGFLIGALTSPVSRGIPYLWGRLSTTAQQRKLKQQGIQSQIAVLNHFFSAPHGRNAAVQASITDAMGEAIKNKDFKAFQDLKDESGRSAVRTMLETGTVDSVFDRLDSMVKGMTPEEFKKAFGLEQDGKDNIREKLDEFRTKAHRISDLKEDLDFKFPNPFIADKPKTPEEYIKSWHSSNAFEEAKWHILSMQQAHVRVLERQSSILKDVQHDLKTVPYSALFVLTDLKRAKEEIKLLKQEASISDPRTKDQKLKTADLLEALIPTIEAGNLDGRTFQEYLNHIQRAHNELPVSDQQVQDNWERLNDFFQLKGEETKLFDNINWLVDPKNFASFLAKHMDYATQVAKDITQKLQEEKKAAEEGDDKGLEIKQRLADIYSRLSENGVIDQQDRDYLEREEVKKAGENNPDYIKIRQWLEKVPKQEQQPTKETPPPPEEGDKPGDVDDKDAYPFYEEAAEGAKANIALPGQLKTVIQEAINYGKDRDPEGDVPLEGGYSFIRGVIARLFKNSPGFFNSFDFVLVNDTKPLYEHASQMSEETQKQLDIFNKNSPYKYFLKDNNNFGGAVIVIRDRKTKNLIYFNPYEPGILTNSKKGVIAAFTLDYNRSGLGKDEVKNFLQKQQNQEYVLNSDLIEVSNGAFYDNQKLRTLGEFVSGVNEEQDLHISKGLKDEEWNHPENTRNGGAFLKMGNLNQIKLLPAELSGLKINGQPYSLAPLFEGEYPTEQVQKAAVELRSIIYPGKFQPQNQVAEKMVISYNPGETKGKSVLKIVRLVDTTPDEPDSRKKKFVDSKQSTTTLLAYLLNERRMNVLADPNQDIELPHVEGGEIKFKTLNYVSFLMENLYTNKSRVVTPEGTKHITPINNFFTFGGIVNQIKTPAPVQKQAEAAAEVLTGETPAVPAEEPKPATEEGGETKVSSEELLKKLKEGSNKPLKDENFDDALGKMKEEVVDKALIGNEELQFIKDRFGDHVLNHMAYAVNSNYWGYWRNSVITLYSDARKGVGYHEAWHHFSQVFLTVKQKLALYEEVRKRADLGSADLKTIEEHLADDFAEYVLSGGTKVLGSTVKRNIFQKIWDFLKRLFTGPKNLGGYYQDLYKGKLENYSPTINNALWRTLSYGFTVPGPDNNKPVELFDAQELNIAKGLFNTMLHRAFASEDEDYNLKNIGISMASITGLRSNPKKQKKALEYVYQSVRNQVIGYITENAANLDKNPASLSLLNRLISHFNEFFNYSMKRFQIDSNVEDTVDQEEDPTTLPAGDIKGEEGEEIISEDMDDPEVSEAQFSDNVIPIEDKGIFATISKVMRNIILTIPRAEAVYNDEGKIASVREAKNEYGFPEPCDYSKVINILSEELAGNFKDEDILEKLNSEHLLQRLPEVKFIRDVLPDFSTNKGHFSIQTLMSLMRDFNRVYTGVYSLLQFEDGKFAWIEQTKNTENKIRREWQDNFLNSVSVKIASKTNSKYLNPDFVALNSELVKIIKDDPQKTLSNRLKLLKKLGIVPSGRTIKTKEFKELVLSNGFIYFINSMKDRLQHGQTIENPLRDMARNFSYRDGEEQVVIPWESRFVSNLLRIESLFSDRVPSNMYKTAKGTNKYALMLPNQFNIVSDALRKAKSIQDISSRKELAYLTDPTNYYLNNSLVLRSLFDIKGIKRSEFEFGDYNSGKLRFYDKTIEKQTTEMTGREKLIMDLNALLGFGAIDIMRTGPSVSSYFWQMPEYNHSYQLKTGQFTSLTAYKLPFPSQFYTKGKPNSSFYRAFEGYFFNLLVDELNVMRFSTTPSKKFNEKLKEFGVFEDILPGGLKQDLKSLIKKLERPEETRDKLAPKLEEITEAVKKFFNDETDAFIKYAKEFGIASDSSGRPGAQIDPRIKDWGLSWRNTASLFVLNDFVLNVEFSRIFSGVPQFYSAYHKRARAITSTGNTPNTGVNIKEFLRNTHPITMAAALGKKFNEDIDEVSTNTLKDDYAVLDKGVQEGWEKVGKILGREKEMKEIITLYNQKKNPVNDGEAWMTFDFYRQYRIQVGNWNFDTDEKEYIKEVNKWKIKKELYKSEEEKKAWEAEIERFSDRTYSTFPVMKLQYNGPQKATGIMLPVLHKYSIVPLIPSAYDGSPLGEAQEWMLQNGRQYLTVESGSKNYSSDPHEFWSDPKNRTGFNSSIETDPDTLFAAYLKEQIKTSGGVKRESTWGTQIRSLFFSNMFSEGKGSKRFEKLFDQYEGYLDELVEIERKKIFQEFGIKEGDNDEIKITDVKSFVTSLQKQAELRNLNDNIKRSIEYDEVTGGFKTPLEINTNRQAIVDLVGGMIYRKLVRMKTNGDMLIQISSTGTRRNGEDELRTYTPVFDKKGSFVGIRPAQCKIAFNEHFKPLLRLLHPDGKRIVTVERLNEALKDDSWITENEPEVTIVAYRIPTQEPNSMEVFHVAEFLPEIFGSCIIVPREIVIKSGSDFDHDKLNIFRPSYDKKEGRVLSEQNVKKVYEKALARVLNIQKQNEVLSGLIQRIFEGVGEDREDEEDIEINDTPMSAEDRTAIEAFREASSELKYFYTNQALETYRRSLTSPEMFMQLIHPNSTKTIAPLAKEMAKKQGLAGFNVDGETKTFKNTQIFNYLSNHITFLQNVQGKKDLAMFAVLNKMMQNLQVSGARFAPSFKHTYNQFSGGRPKRVEIELKTTPYLLTKEERAALMPAGEIPIGKTTDIEGRPKQQVVSELMNATVDIEKDPFYIALGVNQFNKGVAGVLILIGVPIERISAFLRQPILIEYYRRQTVKPYFQLADDLPAVPATNVNARDIIGLKNRLMLERYIADKQNNEEESYAEIFDYDFLKEDIGRGNWNTNPQKIIFAHFLAFQRMQNMYLRTQQLITTDTKKIATPIASELSSLNKAEVAHSGLIANLETVLSRNYTHQFNMSSDIKRVFQSIMPLGFSKVFTQAVARRMRASDLFVGKAQLLKIEKTFANDFMIYILLDKGEYKNQNFRDFVAGQIKKVKDSKTIADRLLEIKTKYPELMGLYTLAEKLATNISRLNVNIQNIEVLRGMDNTTEAQNVMIEEFHKLLNFRGNETPGKTYSREDISMIREFFKDVAFVALGQSGYNKSLLYITDILPLGELEAMTKKAFEKYQEAVKADPDYEGKFIESFLKDFANENPQFNIKGRTKVGNQEPHRGKYLFKQVLLPGDDQPQTQDEGKRVVHQFKESTKTGYPARTAENASADLTLAFAIDFTSAGEVLTKKLVKQQGKLYMPIDLKNQDLSDERIKKIADKLGNGNNIKTINIAGNGAYTLKGKYTQSQVDDFIYNFLKKLLSASNFANNVELIRSGGQTGADEAGTKAAMKLKINSLTLAPKGWTFRDESGKDISDEQGFKARFGEVYTPSTPTSQRGIETLRTLVHNQTERIVKAKNEPIPPQLQPETKFDITAESPGNKPLFERFLKEEELYFNDLPENRFYSEDELDKIADTDPYKTRITPENAERAVQLNDKYGDFIFNKANLVVNFMEEFDSWKDDYLHDQQADFYGSISDITDFLEKKYPKLTSDQGYPTKEAFKRMFLYEEYPSEQFKEQFLEFIRKVGWLKEFTFNPNQINLFESDEINDIISKKDQGCKE